MYHFQLKQVAIIANNNRIENQLQNAFLTSQRHQQSVASKRVRKSGAIVAPVVEVDDVTENPFPQFEERISEYDVLSHQFSAKSDYCQAVSFGFHSEAALRFRVENPKMLPNLYVGIYRGTALVFVDENPGK